MGFGKESPGYAMTTHIKVPRAHRLGPILAIVAMLLASVAASGKSTLASRCPDQNARQKAEIAAAVQAQLAHAAAQPGERRAAWHDAEHDAESVSTGLDLEVRIWNVRIAFPWLKSLPLTPGRHIVLSLWEPDTDR